MSSLLASASPWQSDNAVSRKRTPTMGLARKTIKTRPPQVDRTDFDKYNTDEQTIISPLDAPESFTDSQQSQTERNKRVNEIIDRITSFSNDDKLGDFNPMPYPTVLPTTAESANKEPMEVGRYASPDIPNPLLPRNDFPVFQLRSPAGDSTFIRPSDTNKNQSYSNYREAYGRESMTNLGKSSGKGGEPYYASSGDRMMDRLNHITQMLENIQMEKTNHITEEFVLYCLLGVFMIYIVDGFSRGGKYVR